jgi:hypothetical protein
VSGVARTVHSRDFAHIVQLHFVVPAPMSTSAANRTAPQ